MFYKKSVLKNFAKLTGKHLCQSLFINNFIKKEALAQVLSDEFATFLRTPFFIEHLWWLLLALQTFLINLGNFPCRGMLLKQSYTLQVCNLPKQHFIKNISQGTSRSVLEEAFLRKPQEGWFTSHLRST